MPKKMTECTGKEILTEVYGHLGFKSETADLLADANCISCLLPLNTSQFMPRSPVLGLEDHLPPIYKGLEHPYALVTALKRILD